MTSATDRDITYILRNIPIFQGLSDGDYAEIIPLLRPEKYPPGARIIKEGAHGDSMCVIVKGTVKVTKTDEAGEEILTGDPLCRVLFRGVLPGRQHAPLGERYQHRRDGAFPP